MVYFTSIFLAFLLSGSRAQVLPPSNSSFFVISVIPDDASIGEIGYLASTGIAVGDPYENENTVYSVSSYGTLVSYKSNKGDPEPLGVIATKPGVPNVLLAAISKNEANECALITGNWSIVKGKDGYESLAWLSSEFPLGDAYFCTTNSDDIGGKVFAVFVSPPGENCVNVTLELGGARRRPNILPKVARK